MKKAIVMLALAAAAASPAFAASHHSKASQQEATGAYASANSQAVTSDPDAVVYDNEVVGRDPDPNVRLMIRRDPDLQAN
jgi:hypothetical protein